MSRMRFVGLCLAAALLTTVSSYTNAAEKRTGAAAVGTTGTTATVGAVRTPGTVKPPVTGGKLGTVVELNINECERLGCTALDDKTCAPVGVPGAGTIQKRCVCQGGGNQCIDKNAW